MAHRKGSKIKPTVPYLNGCFAEHAFCCSFHFLFCLNLFPFCLYIIFFFSVMCYIIPSCSLLPSSLMLWAFVFLFPSLFFCCLAKGSRAVFLCAPIPLAHTILLLFYTQTSAPSSCLLLLSSYYFLFPPFAYGLKYLQIISRCLKEPISCPATPCLCSQTSGGLQGGNVWPALSA